MRSAGNVRRTSPSRLGLWSTSDLLAWTTLSVAGLVMVVAAWYQASGQAHLSRQVGMADLAVAGLIVACVAHVVWVLSARRTIGERRRTLLGQGVPPRVVAIATPTSTGTESLVAGEGTRLFHRASCSLAEGRGWPSASRDEHRRAGRAACGMCQP